MKRSTKRRKSKYAYWHSIYHDRVFRAIAYASDTRLDDYKRITRKQYDKLRTAERQKAREAKRAEAKRIKVQTLACKAAEKALRIEPILADNYRTRIAASKGQWFVAYKATLPDGRSPTQPNCLPKLTCSVGALLTVPGADCGPVACAAGVNVATAKFCTEHYSTRRLHNDLYAPDAYRFWKVLFRKEDVAFLPVDSGGKFRLFSGRVIEEISRETLEELAVMDTARLMAKRLHYPTGVPFKTKVAYAHERILWQLRQQRINRWRFAKSDPCYG